MNIVDYVNSFGKKTFEESSFNEVDALVLAQFCYTDFEAMPFFQESPDSILSIQDFNPAGRKTVVGSVDAAFHGNLLRKMKKSARFGKIRFGLVEATSDPERIIQFAASTVFLPDGTMVICYRGTDASLLGWNEDFLITYEKELPSHKLSVEYAHRVLTLYPDCPFYLVGHSKGGNLAIFASCKLRQSDFERLIMTYNFDGPDFRYPPHTFEERNFKWVKYMTRNDMVGSFYNLSKEPTIVYSSGALLGGHDPFYWSINSISPTFRRAKDRSRISYVFETVFSRWLAKLDDDDLELAVSGLIKVLEKNQNIYSLLYRGIPDLLNWKKALKDYPEEKQKRFQEIFTMLAKETAKAIKEETKRSTAKK